MCESSRRFRVRVGVRVGAMNICDGFRVRVRVILIGHDYVRPITAPSRKSRIEVEVCWAVRGQSLG